MQRIPSFNPRFADETLSSTAKAVGMAASNTNKTHQKKMASQDEGYLVFYVLCFKSFWEIGWMIWISAFCYFKKKKKREYFSMVE